MKNAYAAKIQERKRLERHVTRQLMADCALIAANIVFGAGGAIARVWGTPVRRGADAG